MGIPGPVSRTEDEAVGVHAAGDRHDMVLGAETNRVADEIVQDCAEQVAVAVGRHVEMLFIGKGHDDANTVLGRPWAPS